MVSRDIQNYGNMFVGQRVEFSRLDNFLPEDHVSISSNHTITAILESDIGVFVTLKGEFSTIIKAFDRQARTLDGLGHLSPLGDDQDQEAAKKLLRT